MMPKRKIRTLIVDDEPLARETVRLLIKDDSEIKIVGECSTGQEAIALLDALSPDLLFLDIQMPDINGFDVLARVDSDRMPTVVFVTAYDRYALRAFEVEALDYLLKPFTDKRFRTALARAKAHIEGGRVGDANKKLRAVIETYRSQQSELNESSLRKASPSYTDRLIIKSGGQVSFFQVDEVDWIGAADYYVELHIDGKAHLLRETLGSLEARLDPNKFLRIHRSTIVNVRRVTTLKSLRRRNYQVILRDGTKLELSRRRRDKLRAMLGRLS